MAVRINLTLDEQYAAKLSQLAERMHVQEGTLAKSLLSSALDGADPSANHIVTVLDAIPGALERADEGLAEVVKGETVPLDDLA